MRRLSPFLVLAAAALILGPFAGDASAGPRSFGHGVRGGGKLAVAGHRGIRHAGLHRLGHGRFVHHRLGHHRFGHGFHRGAFLGSPWAYVDGYGYGSGAPVNVAVEQNVVAGGHGPPGLLDLPASAGIRSESAAQPVIYVIRSGPGRLGRTGHGHRPGAKVVSLAAGTRAAGGSPGPGAAGPRIVEVTAPRGL
ncbi:MAG TPA: hypothetical protein VF601_00605 [Beijerinckiaceae bacterium]|jgi:hypothetical protein